jgi:multidrug efflux system membrane fusion protein
VIVLAAVLYGLFGRSSSPQTAPSNVVTRAFSTSRIVPVITAKAQLEDFVIRQRTIGILESPAIVVLKSWIDSQVLQQHGATAKSSNRGSGIHTR